MVVSDGPLVVNQKGLTTDPCHFGSCLICKKQYNNTYEVLFMRHLVLLIMLCMFRAFFQLVFVAGCLS